MKIKVLILFLSLLCIFSCGKEFSKKKQPLAVKGILDLRDLDFAKDGPVKLNGEWNFYWKKFVPPNEIEKETPWTAKVPLSWNSQQINDRQLPGNGYATYHLRILIKPRISNLALKFDTIGTAYDCFLNGKKIISVGTVGTNGHSSIPKYLPAVVEFNENKKLFDLVFHVSNFDHKDGGIWYPIIFADSKRIYEFKEKGVSINLLVLGISILMFLYYIGMVILRPKEKLLIYFALFCILIGLRVATSGEMVLLQYFPFLSYEFTVKIQYLTFYLLSIAFFQFLYFSYPEDYHKKMIQFITIFYAIYSLIVIFTRASFFSSLIIFAQLLYLIIISYSLITSVIIVYRKRNGSILMLLGVMFITFAAINDILYAMEVIESKFMISFSFIFMILVHSQMISLRFSRAFDSVDELSKKLDKKNIQLNDMNINLESKVKQRTEELEDERNKLKSRNELVEQELSLAKVIQDGMIPKKTPADFISSFYKPIEKVGGDFYDFLFFRDSKKIGLFFSDVSGHGIPAAFITSMVKTIILQSGPKRENPSELLEYLNEVLFGQTAGHFITAFYGIYDPSLKTLEYSNAGHPQPYLIDRDISQLKGKKQTAIGMFSNETLMTKNKKFLTHTIEFKPGTKLFLYTDGLTEASPIDSKILFEESKLFEVLIQSKDLPGKNFIENIYKELLAFRKIEHFQDDICMVCLDIE